MRLIICGQTTYTNEKFIRTVIISYSSCEKLVCITTDETGVATIVKQICRELKIPNLIFSAQTKHIKKQAELSQIDPESIRNNNMLNQRPDAVLSFSTGNYTGDIITRARKMRIPVIIQRELSTEAVSGPVQALL